MTGTELRVLIIGGYGTFGGRIATLLADEPGLTLLIAGRSGAKAAAFRASLAPLKGLPAWSRWRLIGMATWPLNWVRPPLIW